MLESFTELKRLAKTAAKVEGKALKLALLGDTASQLLSTALLGKAVSNNINLDLFEAPYNQIEAEVLNTSSALHQFAPEYLMLFQSSQKLLIEHAKLDAKEQILLAQKRTDFVSSVLNIFPNTKIICCNYAEIDDSVFGSFANKTENSFLYQLRKLNFNLMELARTNARLNVCDISSIQNTFGRENIFKSNIYTSTDIVFTPDTFAQIAEKTVSIISAQIGKLKKCLVLDLDNVLWGGILGDDGLENIEIGSGLGIGKAFFEFQLWCKKLKQRGILLAVCSKNNEDAAKEVFEKHPNMILRLSDFAAFKANWKTKPENIIEIQKTLNISYDSMVFLDDSTFERELIKQSIPELTVPTLPSDPAEYLDYLCSLNLFETNSISAENRTEQYQAEAQRSTAQKTFANTDDFLQSLNMQTIVSELNAFNIPRIAELSMRSNQFNLRTVRYSESDLQKISEDKNYRCLAFALSDNFGESGLVSTIILKKISDTDCFIESWFLSCRVFQRGLENFVLNETVCLAKKLGFKRFLGEYIPTKKNEIVKDLYTSLGFEKLENAENKNLFSLNLENFKPLKTFINKK